MQKDLTTKKNEPMKQGNIIPKEKVIKISEAHHQMLESERQDINRDGKFKKKISIKRYIEKLIEDHRKACVADLKKEREQSEDWLRLEHQKKSPETPFFDWLKKEMERIVHGGKTVKPKSVNPAKSIAVLSRGEGT